MNKKNKVIIYSTPTCPYCVMAKNYFNQAGVEYEDINVAENREKAKEMIIKSGQRGVPVVEINEELVLGFRPDVFEQLLAK